MFAEDECGDTNKTSSGQGTSSVLVGDPSRMPAHNTNKGGALPLKILIRTKKVQVCGEGGIRTLGTVARTTVFETAPFDRSGTSPVGPQNYGNLLGRNDLAVVFFSPDVIGHWSLVAAGSVAIRNYWYLLCLLPIAYLKPGATQTSATRSDLVSKPSRPGNILKSIRQPRIRSTLPASKARAQ